MFFLKHGVDEECDGPTSLLDVYYCAVFISFSLGVA